MTGSFSAPLQHICDYLVTKYKPEAILLHGSRIYDDAPETSDYDLAIITNQPEKIFPHEYEGMMLDLEGIALDTKILQTGNRVPKWPLQIVFDGPERRGKMLHDNTQAAYLKGPDPLSDQEWSNRENYTTRLINKIQSRSSNTSVRHYYMSDFYTRAIRYWFEKRQIWTMPAHQALPRIEAEDPVFFEQLQNLWSGRYSEAVTAIKNQLF